MGVYPLVAQIECWDPAMRTRDSKLSVQLYGGTDYMLSSLSESSIAETGYLQSRENSITSLPGFKMGGLLKFNITDRFYAKAGIEYNQLRERFDYIEEEIIPMPTEVIVNTITYRLYNEYKTMGIPILLGYSLVYSPSFELNLDLGIIANLQFDFDGGILEPSDMVNRDGAGYYRNTIGISTVANIEFLKKFSEKFGLFLNLGSKYTFNEINLLPTNPIDQKLVLFGSAVGVQFKI